MQGHHNKLRRESNKAVIAYGTDKKSSKFSSGREHDSRPDEKEYYG